MFKEFFKFWILLPSVVILAIINLSLNIVNL